MQLCILGLTFGIDRIAKANVAFFVRLGSFGPFEFADRVNPGFILETFADVNPFARVVFVCSLYGFLFFGYCFLSWFLPREVRGLHASVSIFFGSISGNAWDRAFQGAVSDFILIRSGSQIVYFNLADCFMWVGMAGVLFLVFRNQQVIWRDRSRRQKFLIDRVFQIRAAFLLSLIAFSMMLILNLFMFTSMRSLGVPFPQSMALFLSGGALGLVFTAIAFFSGVVISHRSAGALYAFERHVEALLRGENPRFRLRKNDEHRRLIEVANRLSETIEEFRKKAG